MTMLLQRFALPVVHRSPVLGIGHLKHQTGQVAIGMNSGFLRMETEASPSFSGLKVVPVGLLGSQRIRTCQANGINPSHIIHPFSNLLSQNLLKYPTHFQLCGFHSSPILEYSDGADHNKSQDLDSDPSYSLRFTVILFVTIFLHIRMIAIEYKAEERAKELSQKLLGELSKPGADKLFLAVRILECELFVGRGNEEASARRVIDIIGGIELPDIIKTANSLIDKKHHIEGIHLYSILCADIVELKRRDLSSQDILVFISRVIPDIARATKTNMTERECKYALECMVKILKNIRSLEHVDQDLKVVTEAACCPLIAYIRGELHKHEFIRNFGINRIMMP